MEAGAIQTTLCALVIVWFVRLVALSLERKLDRIIELLERDEEDE